MIYFVSLYQIQCTFYGCLLHYPGADDVDQLVGLTAKEFQQLCSMIGMDKKPFHVMRFKKALENLSKFSAESKSLEIPPNNTLKTLLAADTTPQYNKSITTPPIRSPPPLLKTCPDQLDHQVPRRSTIQPIHPPYHIPAQSSLVFVQQTPVQVAFDPRFCTSGSWNPTSPRYQLYYPTYGVDKQQSHTLSLSNKYMSETCYPLHLQEPTRAMLETDQQVVLPNATKSHQSSWNNSFALESEASSPISDTLQSKVTDYDELLNDINPTDSPVNVDKSRSFELKHSSSRQITSVTPVPKHGHADFTTNHSLSQPMNSTHCVGKVQPIDHKPIPTVNHLLSKRAAYPSDYSACTTPKNSFLLCKRTSPEPYSSYYSALSSSPHAVSREKPVEINSVSQASSALKSISMGHSTKAPDSRLRYLQAEIEGKRTFQNLQVIAVEEAKQRGDISSSLALEEHVKDLGEELKELERAYTLLSKTQDQHLEEKSCKEPNLQERRENNSFQASLKNPVRLNALEPGNSEHLPATKRARGNAIDTSRTRGIVTRAKKRIAASKTKQKPEKQVTVDPSTAEIKDLMDNITNAADTLNSLINGDKMDW